MLLIHGILLPIDSECIARNIINIQLAHDYKNKWIMLVGDRLTQMRIKYFVDEIHKSCYDLSEQQEVLSIIKEALDQVINVTGYLHGGLLHFLLAS